MSYQATINALMGLSISDRVALIREFDTLVADLTALRESYAELLGKLDADAGVDDTDYADTLALPDPTFKSL